ncbi:MAG: hypothetical protein JNL70_08330 [Saprospiraceae bacterium]|nr:hypothetical protein [Saprospiraceae bacterium]
MRAQRSNLYSRTQNTLDGVRSAFNRLLRCARNDDAVLLRGVRCARNDGVVFIKGCALRSQ